MIKRMTRRKNRMEVSMTDVERIKKALDIAEVCGNASHNQWIIDQMVRALTDCPIVTKKGIDYQGNEYTYKAIGKSDVYLSWVKDYQAGEDGPETYEWDVGIAP